MKNKITQFWPLVVFSIGLITSFAVSQEKIKRLEERTNRDTEIIRQIEKDVSEIKATQKLMLELLKEIRMGR